MIDVVINETGGLTVAHDQKSLDAYDRLFVDVADGSASMGTAEGPARPIGTLAPSMLAMVRDGMPGRAVRTAGWSIARTSGLAIHAAREV